MKGRRFRCHPILTEIWRNDGQEYKFEKGGGSRFHHHPVPLLPEIVAEGTFVSGESSGAVLLLLGFLGPGVAKADQGSGTATPP
jgi:hypothetical protein